MALETEEFPSKRPDVNALLWRGEELRGRRLLVFSEQGLGDVIQLFDICRYCWNTRPTSLFSHPRK